jgi:tryptophan 2,3-dioxygenase
MVGGVPVIPDDSLQSNAAPNSKPNLTNRNPIPPKEKGRPMGAKASVFAKDAIAKVLNQTKVLNASVEAALKKKYSKKNLSSDQRKLAEGITEAIIIGCEGVSWKEKAEAVVKDPSFLDKLSILPEIQEMAAEHQLDTYAAGLLYHSTKLSV